MHNYRDPTPPTPSTTNKEKSIIPLKQCNCKKTTHSSTYLSYGTKSECTTGTLISLQTLLGLFSFDTATSESTMNFQLNDWRKKNKVYVTVFYILRAYFKSIYRKEYTCKVCVSTYSTSKFFFSKRRGFFWQILVSKVSNHLLVLVLTEIKWTPGQSKESNQGFLRNRPVPLRQSPWRKNEGQQFQWQCEHSFGSMSYSLLSYSVPPSLHTVKHRKPPSLSQSPVQGISHAALVVSYPSVIGRQPQYYEKPYIPKNI